jgi:DNA-binding NarL/FixJ family response regulator
MSDPKSSDKSMMPESITSLAMQKLKVLVADDHQLVRDGLKLALLQLEKNIEIVEADSLDKAIAACKAHEGFDLVLLDLNMPGTTQLMALDGFERECPDARIVVISASHDMQTVQAAIRRGVLGFIPKTTGKGSLVAALRFVLAGGVYVPPEMFLNETGIIQPAAQSIDSAAAITPQAAGLTARQVDVLNELLDGKSNKRICRDLGLAMGTVKGHVAAVLHTLGVKTRAEAISAADRRGWRQILKTAHDNE